MQMGKRKLIFCKNILKNRCFIVKENLIYVALCYLLQLMDLLKLIDIKKGTLGLHQRNLP